MGGKLSGLVFLLTLGGLTGFCIGCVGVGGVVLVPALVHLAGVDIRVAIPAAMMGYLLTGAIGTAIYARGNSIAWPMVGWLCAGAMPMALVGSWAALTVPRAVLEVLIAALTLSAGARALLRPPNRTEGTGRLGPGQLLGIGAITGVLSAMTGTGGPLVLVPLMLWLGAGTLVAVGLSQAVQFPIAAVATAGHLAVGSPDLAMGAVLAVGLACGAYLGAKAAHKLPQTALQRIVACVLLGVGLAMLWQLAQHAWA